MINGFCKKLPHVEINGGADVVYDCSNFPGLTDMCFRCLEQYKYFVQVDQCELQFPSVEDNFYGSLRGAMSILESEWHGEESIQSLVKLECGLFSIRFSIPVCQYPLLAISVAKIAASDRDSMHSSIREIWYVSQIAIPFSLR